MESNEQSNNTSEDKIVEIQSDFVIKDDYSSHESDDEYCISSKRLKIDEEVCVYSNKNEETIDADVNIDGLDEVDDTLKNKVSEKQIESNDKSELSLSSCDQQNLILKVPPLKIICSRGDFSLVNDENSQKSNENLLESNEHAKNMKMIETNQEKPLDEISSEDSTKINEHLKNIEKYDSSPKDAKEELDNTTTSTRNSDYVNKQLIDKSSTIIEQREAISDKMKTLENINKRQFLNASPVVHESIKISNRLSPQCLLTTSASSPQLTIISQNMSSSSEANNIIKRKLRSHTRQQQQKKGSTEEDNLKTIDGNNDTFVNIDESKKEEFSNSNGSTSSSCENVEDEKQSNLRKKKTRQNTVLESFIDDNNCEVRTNSAENSSEEQIVLNQIPDESVSPQNSALTLSSANSNTKSTANVAVTNCIRKYIDMRLEINKRHEKMMNYNYEVKLPRNFNEFILSKRNYLINSNKEAIISIPLYSVPTDVCAEMKEMYKKQEKERYNLRIRHKIEQDKLLILYEQELLRCFNQYQRGIKNRPTPLSFSTLIRDDEIYSLYPSNNVNIDNAEATTGTERKSSLNELIVELEHKFLKLKDDLVKRQLNESDSLYAVQRMDWQSKLKYISNTKLTNVYFDDSHVPIVAVNNADLTHCVHV